MCGIHGFVSGKRSTAFVGDFIKDGFIAGSIRGSDASGIASIGANKLIRWQRLPISGPMFVGDRFAQVLATSGSLTNTITIAHTRAATSGIDTGINGAHPFYVDVVGDGMRELIGVHNGSLTDWKRYKDANQFEVDSEWALNHIYTNGAKAFEDFNGPFVFTWWDGQDHDVLNFALAHNNQRFMHVGFTEEDNMAFATEPGMLAWLMERRGIKVKGPILGLQAGFWYKFNQNGLFDFTAEEIPKFVSPATIVYGGSGSYRSRGVSKSVMTAMRELVASTIKPKIPASNVIDLRARIKVSAEEVKAARELGVLGKKGIFTPELSDPEHEELAGSVLLEDVIFNAVIPKAHSFKFDNKTRIHVVCCGINEELKDFLAICTVNKTMAAEAEAAARDTSTIMEQAELVPKQLPMLPATVHLPIVTPSGNENTVH